MKNLLLVRHGESIQNTGINSELRIPDHAVYLTETGKSQARAAGTFLSKWMPENNLDITDTRIWVSPYERTRQTAELINESLHIGDIREDDMLVELQFGIFDNIPKDKIKELFPVELETFQNNRKFNGKFYARRPGGESPFDAEIRQRLFISSIYRDFNNGGPSNLIIVGHGAATNLLLKAFFHYSHEWYEAEKNPGNCSIRHIEIGNINEYKGYIFGDGVD